mgnify:CR=1 FL=1
MMRDMTEERFQQEIEAKFTEFVGRVFKSFDEEIHVRDVKYNPDLPVHLAADYGWTNPTVVLAIQVDVFDNVHVIADYRRTNRDIEDIADDFELDEVLATDLTAVEYGFTAADQIQLERKEDMKKRGLASPDRGDALALTFAQHVTDMPPPPGGVHGAGAGRDIAGHDPYALRD